MTIELTTTVARNETILFTDLDDTVVMMDVDEGRYYELDPVGAKIWTLLDTARTVAELCEALVAAYDVEPEVCRRDVLAFLNEIEDMGLVRVDRLSAGGDPASRTGGSGSFITAS